MAYHRAAMQGCFGGDDAGYARMRGDRSPGEAPAGAAGAVRRAGRRVASVLAAMLTFTLAGSGPAAATSTFSSPTSYPVGAPAAAIAYGDFIGDHVPDLAIARPTMNDVVVQYGRLDGSFWPPSAPIQVGQDPVSIANCTIPYSLQIRPGSPPLWGPFFPIPSLDGPYANPFAAPCGLVVADAGSHDIAVIPANRDGTFGVPTFIPVDGTPGSVVASADGVSNHTEIVFTEPALNRIGVISQRFDGTFGAPTYVNVGTGPEALIAGNVWGTNPHAIVAVADAGSHDVRVFTDGHWASPLEWTNVGADPSVLAFGGFGLAVADGQTDEVTFLGFQPATGATYQTAQSAPIPISGTPIGMAPMTDPGGVQDGDLAVLTAHGTVHLLRQNGPGVDYSRWPMMTGWPSFSDAAVSVPGSPSAIVSQSFGSPLSPDVEQLAAPPPTDLATLDPSGTTSVLLQARPRLLASPARLEFGRVVTGSSSTAQLTIANVGSIAAPVDRVVASPNPFSAFYNPPYSIAADGCTGQVLQPGERCQVTFRFAPTVAGDWMDMWYAFGSPASSSLFAAPRFDGEAYSQATISAAAAQPLARSLRRGLTAVARCTAACTVVVDASVRAGRRVRTLGSAMAVLTSGGSVPVRVRLRGAASRLRGARVLLAATAQTLVLSDGVIRSVTRPAGSVRVRLTR